jgi:uncharacterized RDD family membrane protein YckC
MSPNPAAGRMEQLAQGIAARVVNLVLEAIDVDALVAKVDVDALVKQVDVESIIERVDVERIIERVDVDAIVQRVDVDAIVQRVDINAIVSSMDIDSLVEKTELGAIIARSTTGVFTEVLDVIRAQGVGLDDFCARWTNRILRRRPGTLPAGPGLPPAVAATTGTRVPVAAPAPDTAPAVDTTPASDAEGDGPALPGGPAFSMPPSELTVERQGQYAGAVSRLAAFALDVGASWGIYVAACALLSFAVQLITGHSYDVSKHPVVAISTLVVWTFAYFSYQWAVAGRTIGMAVFGIRVVRADGGPTNGRAAVIRTLTLPLSIVVFFLGFLGILTNRERRAWHDLFAGTAVVYAWDARAARLRWLADRETPAAT